MPLLHGLQARAAVFLNCCFSHESLADGDLEIYENRSIIDCVRRLGMALPKVTDYQNRKSAY
jgi:hypothetical protein